MNAFKLIGFCALLALVSACPKDNVETGARPEGATVGEGGESTPGAPKASAQDAFNQAVVEYRKTGGVGDGINRARDGFSRAANADPRFALARYNLGVIAEKDNRADDAKKLYREALDLEPSLDLAVSNLGLLYERTGQPESARALYAEIIEKNPETVFARVRLAKLAHREGDPKLAFRLAREALQFDPQSLDAYRLLARLSAEEKRGQLAKLIAARAAKLAPQGDAELTYALALVAVQEKDIAQARALFVRAIDLDAAHIDARVALAEMALQARDWKTAAAQLEALARLDPKNPAVHNALGIALKGHGRFDEARAAYSKALEIDANYTDAALNLAILELRHLQNPEAAEKRLQQYMDGAPKPAPEAPQLLEEARLLIESKAEEKRQLEAMKKAEEEAAKAAANAPKQPEGQAPVEGGAAPPGEGAPAPAEGGAAPPTTTEAPAPPPPTPEPPMPDDDAGKNKKKPAEKKAPPKEKKAEPEKPKPTAPEKDEGFFND